ncbi:MAG: hypothetical protein ACI80S_001166, partial [Pseudohongiellaceae bacterium]
EQLKSATHRETIVKEFTQLHRDIKGDADRVAATAIYQLLHSSRNTSKANQQMQRDI